MSAKTSNWGFFLQDTFSLCCLACRHILPRLPNSSPCSVPNKQAEDTYCSNISQRITPNPFYSTWVCVSALFHSLLTPIQEFGTQPRLVSASGNLNRYKEIGHFHSSQVELTVTLHTKMEVSKMRECAGERHAFEE